MKLEIFDPPMCCSTGICGSHADPKLVVFASDLEWLKSQGVKVVRHGLAFAPSEFTKNTEVKDIIKNDGNASLPILTFNSKVVSKACYPSRKILAQICNVEFNEDDAPPIHREENCCCGVNCDCRTQTLSNNTQFCDSTINKCNCTNAAAEDNCICTNESTPNKKHKNSLSEIFFGILILIILGLIAVKMFF